MSSRNRNLLKSILLLFGSYVFARYLSTFIHEHGHAIAVWVTGGIVNRIIFTPFSGSCVIHFRTPADCENFVTWSGPLLAVFVGLLLVIIIWRWRRPSLMPVLLTGVAACIHNGFSLIFSCLSETSGDANNLVTFGGTPKAVVLAVGFPMFLIGVFLFIKYLPMFGLQSRDGFKRRILVIGPGLFPYLIATLIYNWQYNVKEFGLWAVKLTISAFLILLLTALSGVLQRRFRLFRDIETKVCTWTAVVIANASALVVIVFLFFILPNYPFKTHTEHKMTYYDGQSNFAGTARRVRDYVWNPYREPYKTNRKSAVFWSWQGREGKVKIAHRARSAAICPDSLEVMVFTTGGVLMVPMDGGPRRWLFKQDGISLMPGCTISKDTRRALFYGIEDSASGKGLSWFLIAIDIPSGRTTKFVIEKFRSGMEFLDSDTAVVSICEKFGSEEQDLIRVEFTETGDHKFILETQTKLKGNIRAVYDGKLVLGSGSVSENKSFLQFDDKNFSFTGQIYVYASESYIWIIDYEGQVLRVNPDGDKSYLDTCNCKSIIGCGTFDDSFWVAFRDGEVKVFGDNPATAKIELP